MNCNNGGKGEGEEEKSRFIKVSEELLADDGFDMEAHLTAGFARCIGVDEEETFLASNGTGEPTGLFDVIKVGEAGVSAQKATDVSADELWLTVFYSSPTLIPEERDLGDGGFHG